MSHFQSVLIGSAMSAMMLCMLLGRAFDILVLTQASYVMSGVIILAGLNQIKWRETYLLGCSFLLIVALFMFTEQPFDALMKGVAQASFLMAFMGLLSLLYEAAMTSSSVTDCGRYLTSQRAGKRYIAIFSGTNLMAVLFNLGILTILSPLIQKGLSAEAENKQITALKEKRQLSAMVTGFAWCVVWSPTAIAPLALYELIGGIDRKIWTMYGFILSVAVCCVGWLLDKFTNRHLARRRAFRQSYDVPVSAFAKFVLMLCVLFGLASFFSALFDENFVFGLLVGCPLTMLIWFAAQAVGFDQSSLAVPGQSELSTPAKNTGISQIGYIAERLVQVNHFELAKSLRLMITLAGSGFIGSVASFLIPAEQVAQQLGLFALPDYIVLSLLSFIMVPTSFLGVSPIMMAVFFGSLMGSLPALPADPTLIAFAITAGWALSMTLSPFSTLSLIVARLNHKTPAQISFGWHIPFNLVCFIMLVGCYYLLTSGL